MLALSVFGLVASALIGTVAAAPVDSAAPAAEMEASLARREVVRFQGCDANNYGTCTTFLPEENRCCKSPHPPGPSSFVLVALFKVYMVPSLNTRPPYS